MTTQSVNMMTLDEFLHHLDNATGATAERAASEIALLQAQLADAASDYKMIKREWREYRKTERADRKKQAAKKSQMPSAAEVLTMLRAIDATTKGGSPSAPAPKHEKTEPGARETYGHKTMRQHAEYTTACNCPACAKRRAYYAAADTALPGSGPVFLALRSAIMHLGMEDASAVFNAHPDVIAVCMDLDGVPIESLQ